MQILSGITLQSSVVISHQHPYGCPLLFHNFNSIRLVILASMTTTQATPPNATGKVGFELATDGIHFHVFFNLARHPNILTGSWKAWCQSDTKQTQQRFHTFINTHKSQVILWFKHTGSFVNLSKRLTPLIFFL